MRIVKGKDLTPKPCRSLEHRDASATMQLKVGTLIDGHLIIPASTELLFADVATFEITNVISLPSFNDLHHVNAKTACYMS